MNEASRVAPRRKMRGAMPTPGHRLLRATPYCPVGIPPNEFLPVPPSLSMWGNAQYGNCVTAEEAFAKASYSVQLQSEEMFVPEEEAVRWARVNGFLNGAYLTEVMDRMQQSGFLVGPEEWRDGPYFGVDYSDEIALRSAISQGPVKIAIDADALPPDAGDRNGWYALRGGNFPRTDHCVSLSMYGSAQSFFNALGLPVPAAVPVTLFGYGLFTWSSIGFVTHDWIMSTCVEAWYRNPTTPDVKPNPVPPQIPPWALAVLKALCASVDRLPVEYQWVALLACSLIPSAKRCK